jgi:SAM-dependent methyltransferase
MTKPKYQTIPNLEPYSGFDKERFDKPKATFLHTAGLVEKFHPLDSSASLLDVGCANGELLYYLRTLFPQMKLAGIDNTPEYIEVAQNIPELKGVSLTAGDLFDLDGTYDVVTMIGVFNVFAELEKPLDALLEACKPGGIVLTDGLFNQFNIDIRVSFCDNSKKESRGLWRSDFHQHAQKTIGHYLDSKSVEYWFEEIVMNVDLPRRIDSPHVDSFTFLDENGKRIITNGLNFITNRTMLVIKNGEQS